MAKKKLTAQQIEARISALQAELATTRRAEADAADQDLLRLVHRAGMLDEVTALARQRIEQHRATQVRGTREQRSQA